MKYYYNQLDYANIPYDRKNTTVKETVKTSGCGVCALLMCINNLADKELYTVSDLASFSIKSGARDNTGTNLIKLLNAFCKKNTDFTYRITNDIKEVVEHLKNNGYAIANQGDIFNVFSTNGHFVVLSEMITNSVVNVADPYLYSNKYDKYNRKFRIVAKTTQGCAVATNIVDKACQDRNPKYYLISYEKYGSDRSKIEFKPYNNYTLLYDINVRTGAGTNYRKKKVKELTVDGKRHAITNNELAYAVLKKGTKVTAKKVIKRKNGEIWLQIPSGFVCAYQNKYLIK